jgi:phage-related minor tail protein
MAEFDEPISGGSEPDFCDDADDADDRVNKVRKSTDDLTASAKAFSRAMSQGFVQATIGGKQLDDVFRSLALRMSSFSVGQALKPFTDGVASGFDKLLGGLFSGIFGAKGAALGAVKPFAAGGVIGTPTYFPLSPGGLGLAGEAGPEAIIPLARGPDGRLGVSAQGAGGAANITIQISTPDADSFRRSENYITGQIARAVARGQRSL